jgi:ribulose kinase
MDEAKFVSLLVFIAATLEWGIEHYVGPLVDLVVGEDKARVRKAIFVSLSGAAGIALSFAFKLGMVHEFVGQGSVIADRVMTGLILAAGMETAHGLIKRLFPTDPMR